VINRKDILKRAMKDKIRSLLGIEMSLGQTQFKPFLIILGLFIFTWLLIPLAIMWVYLQSKITLLELKEKLKKTYKSMFK